MAPVRVVDLDGSVTAQAKFLPSAIAECVPAREWGRQIRLACQFGVFNRFERWLAESLPSTGSDITFIGSGDFHHVTLALLRPIQEPFNLMILDNHPDWMRGLSFLHCGTWLWHALPLKSLRRVFLCGGEADFDNAYRWLAPWAEIQAGRLIVIPVHRRFTRGRWAGVCAKPLIDDGCSFAKSLHECVEPHRQELAVRPLYVSIDKDVLAAEDAAVNWDSGLLRLPEAVAVVQAFVGAAGGRLAGADLLGDWSPVSVAHWLNRMCDRLHNRHSPIVVADATRRNSIANLALLEALRAEADQSH
jgi:hypothetical protein